MESIETRLSQATTDATAAVKTALDCKSIVAECVSDVGALQSNYSDFVNIMNEKCEKLELQCKQHKEQILLQETYSRKKNLIVRGLTLSRQEPCDHTVRRFLVEVMGIPAARGWIFSNCHPLERGPKPAIIVRFAFQQQREMVWNKHGILKPTHFYLSEDYPAEIESRRRFMYPIIARSNHLPAYKGKLRIRLDKLLFNGNVYCHDMLHLLPAPINPQTISQIENDQCVAIGGVSSCYNGWETFLLGILSTMNVSLPLLR